ncbi:MAG: hypothetical protein K2M92_04710, partial [Bacteroidales bacterium]|nr:hypothetical protein [Bacteroidales bacterium]
HTAHTLPKYSCPGETDTLSFSYKQNENHPVTIAWYKNGALLRKSTNANDTVCVLSDFVNFDTVYAVVSLPFECGSERAHDTAVFPLRRHITPKVELTWFGRDSVCAGDTVKMFVKILDNPDDTAGYTYQWYMNGVAVPAPLGQFDTLSYAPSAGTSVSCAVKADYGCSAAIDGPVFTTNPGPSILPVPDPTIWTVDSVCPGKDFTLSVKAVQGGSYAWSSFDTIAHTFAQDTNVLVTSQTIPTQYFVEVASADGCPSYDTVAVGMITPDSLWARVKQKTDTCTPAVIEHPAWRMSGSMIPMVDGQVVRSSSQGTGWTNLVSTTAIDGDFKLRYVITGQEVPGMVGINYVNHTHPANFNTANQYAASYAFYISWHNGGHDLQIYENGTYRYGGHENWQTGDILFIVRQRGFIYYYHNEHLIRKVRDYYPNTAMNPEVSLYNPATAFARIDFARLPNVSISATAGNLTKLDHEWYVNGKLVSRSANPNMGDFELVN